MDRKEIQSVGDVLRQAIMDNDLQGRLDELQAADLWPKIIGPDIAARTMKPLVRSGNMTIRVTDASLRHELNMNRTRIVKEINRLMKKEVISSIRFIG